MKKIIIYLIVCAILVLGIIYFGFVDKKESKLTKITVAEVTHSAFYAPWYVAIEEGYFEDVGLDIEVILTPGADKTAAAVLSGDAQIGFSGPEATIYIYNNGEEDYLKTFAALTKRDGQFLVGDCEELENFNISNLVNKSVLAGRTGGMPLMVFTYALNEAKIDLNSVHIDSSVEFAALSGAYINGGADYVNLFEPIASSIESQKYGCVLASIGLLAGEVPYTAYYSKTSYIKENKDILQAFNEALNKGLQYVHKNEPQLIAKKIVNQFPDITINELANIIERYKNADSWWETTYIEESAFERLQDIMIFNKALIEKQDFSVLVTNEFNERNTKN